MFHRITPKTPGVNHVYRSLLGTVQYGGRNLGTTAPSGGGYSALAQFMPSVGPMQAQTVDNTVQVGSTVGQADGAIGFVLAQLTNAGLGYSYIGGIGGGSLISGQSVSDLCMWSNGQNIWFAVGNGSAIAGGWVAGSSPAVFRINSAHASGVGLNFNDTGGSPQSFDIGLGVGDAAATLNVYDRTGGNKLWSWHPGTSGELLTMNNGSSAGGAFLSWRAAGTEVGFLGNGTSVGGAGSTDFGVGCDSAQLILKGQTGINFKVGASSVAILTAVATNGTGTPTFGANKPTASSASTGWLQFTIGGVTRYIPFWA